MTPTMVEKPMLRAHRVQVVGRTAAVRARVYAVSPERRLKHPAVAAICDAGRAGTRPRAAGRRRR